MYDLSTLDPTIYSTDDSLGGWVTTQYGHAWLNGWNRRVTIWDVAIDPEHQGQGHGRTLMEKVLALVDDKGWEAHLLVEPRNTPAIRLYESLGFIAKPSTQRTQSVEMLRPIRVLQAA